MMQLREFQQLVDSVFPPAAAMSGDPIGTQVASRRSSVRHVYTCFEVTDQVIAEAVQRGCDTIVTFHPLIYTPLRTINRDERVGRLVCSLIEHDVALIVVHTAFDAHPQGTNTLLAQHLGVRRIAPLVPSIGMPDFGMGLLGELDSPTSMQDFLSTVERVTQAPLRYGSAPLHDIRTVAMVAGSGASFLEHAIAAGVDVFLTADIKYHAFHQASGAIGLIDAGHFEMEQFVAQGIADLLQPRCADTVAISTSTVGENPVRYYFQRQQDSSTYQVP